MIKLMYRQYRQYFFCHNKQFYQRKYFSIATLCCHQCHDYINYSINPMYTVLATGGWNDVIVSIIVIN